MVWKFVLSLIFSLMVALFAIQNAASVDVNFIFWHISVSQAFVIIISAILGATTVMALSLVKQVELNAAIKSDKNTILALENENQSLKNKLEEANAKVTASTVPEQETSDAQQNQ
jgi:lipopolysaccharide assembly protein A